MGGASCVARSCHSTFVVSQEQFQGGSGGAEEGEVCEEFSVGYEQVNAGVRQDVIDLVRLKEIVDRHDHCAGAQDPEECGHEFWTVLQPKAHAISALNPKPALQSLRDQERLSPQFRIGVFTITPKQGDFVPVLPCGCREGAGQIHAAKYYEQ